MHGWWMAVVLALTVREALDKQPCPPEGDGGDPILNTLKNRIDPPTQVKPMSVPVFLRDLTPNLAAPKYRNKFKPAQRDYVESREKTGVALDGYLLAAHQSGPESCNCHLKEARDFHVWIGDRKPDDRADAKAMRAQAVAPVLREIFETLRNPIAMFSCAFRRGVGAWP